MRRHRQRRPRGHATAKETYPKSITSSKGLTIEPPPKETGPEPLYRVVSVIDVNAPNARQAAERAHQIMGDPQSMRPVLDILDADGRWTQVDLSQE